jgi:hypothetical protein
MSRVVVAKVVLLYTTSRYNAQILNRDRWGLEATPSSRQYLVLASVAPGNLLTTSILRSPTTATVLLLAITSYSDVLTGKGDSLFVFARRVHYVATMRPR